MKWWDVLRRSGKTGWLAIGVFLCVAFSAGFAKSATLSDNLLAEGYLEDGSGTLSFSSVMDRRVTNFNGYLTKGYTSSAYWVKLDVKNTDDHSDLILSVNPDFIEDVRLYDSLKPNEPPVTVGSLYGLAPGEFNSLSRFFRLSFPEDHHIYWLRIATTSTLTVVLDAQPMPNFFVSEYKKLFFYSIYIGIGIVVFIISLFIALHNDNSYYKIFAFQTISSLFWIIIFLGFARIWLGQWISVSLIHDFFNIMTLTMPVTVVLFHYLFLKSCGGNNNLIEALRCYVLIYPIELVVLFLGFKREVLAFNGAFILIIALYISWMAFTLPSSSPKRSDRIPKKYIVLFYITLLIAILLLSLFNFGIVNDFGPLFYLRPMSHSWIHNILMLVLLSWNSKQLRRREAETEAELTYKEGQLSVLGRMIREQESLLAMLTHELKTPLSVIRLVLGEKDAGDRLKQKAQQAVIDIDHIIDHGMAAAQLEGDNLPLVCKEYDIRWLLSEIVERSPRPEQVHVKIEGLTSIWTDRSLFTMMVWNLVSNAFKYGYPMEPINIYAVPLTREGVSGYAIEVSNLPGFAGMPDPALVFQKFYRSKRALNESGAGLGLFLVRSIASYLSGVIDYDPFDGKVRFRVWLPHLGSSS